MKRLPFMFCISQRCFFSYIRREFFVFVCLFKLIESGFSHQNVLPTHIQQNIATFRHSGLGTDARTLQEKVATTAREYVQSVVQVIASGDQPVDPGGQQRNSEVESAANTAATITVEITAESVKNYTECNKICRDFGKFPANLDDEKKKEELLKEFIKFLKKIQVTTSRPDELLGACNSQETAPCIGGSSSGFAIGLGVSGAIFGALIIGGGIYYAL